MRNSSSSTGLLERPSTPLPTQPADDVTVPALTYTQVRLLAECAAGIDNKEAHFVFSGAGLERAPSNAVPETDILVPARQKGRYPQLAQIGLQKTPPLTGLGKAGDEALNAVDYHADAVFWSDSAVQKFLFPYVASCGGSGAAAGLQSLQQVWNGESGTLKVYAVMHVTAQTFATPLDLGNALYVVYAVGDGPIQAQALDEFVDTTLPEVEVSARTADLAQAIRVPYRRGNMKKGQPQSPDYRTLRAMAEYGSTLAGKPYYFVFRAGKKSFDMPISAQLPTNLQPGDFVVPIQTPTVPRNRADLGAVWFQPVGKKPRDICFSGDAIFWSTGAIEQFLYPYYASKLGFAAPEELKIMRQTWDPSYVAPWTRMLAGNEGEAYPVREEGGFAINETEVYALVHLPRSDWVTGDHAVAQAEAWANLSPKEQEILRRDRARRGDAGPSALLEVGVLHSARSGAVNTLPLADFKALYPHRFA